MSMKKILAALLLLMMMVLTAAGAMASANLRVRNTDMQVGQYAYVSWGNEIALSQTKPESGGYVYYRSDNVMEMHDFQFPSYGSFQYTIGVTSGSGLFTMEIYGDNLVNNAYSGQAASTATAIFCALPLEIKLMNGATLRAEATAISEGNQAIWASETLAVTGSGTLNAVGGNTNVSYQNSYGIRVGNSSGASTAMTVGSGVALNAQSGSAPLESMGIYVKQGKLSSAGHITAQSGAGVSEDYAIDASAVEITAGSMTAKAADTSSPAMNTAPSVYTGADVLVSKTSNAAHDPALAYAASEIGQYTFVQVDKAKPEHAHYACGEDECENTRHAHGAALIEYAALDPDYDDGEAWMTGTAYYLKEDIEIKNNNRIVFANTGTVYLCLNGHTITSQEALNSLTANGNLVLCDCQGDGVITRNATMTGRGVLVNGDMTMYGGKISGHHDTGIWGGGAYVGGDMTMYGGTISNNSAQNGAGGVYAVNGLTMHGGKISGNETQRNGGGVLTGSSGVISLYGGEISGNKAAKGGGLYAASDNTVNVSGAPFVMNNLAKGAENNIELSGDVNLKLTGALTGDEQTIGVTKRGTMPVQFMEAAGTAVNDAYIGKVYSDEGHLKKVDNGYGVFYDRNTISVAASPSAGGTVTGTGIYESGTSCLITAAANTGYTFVNWTDADGSVFSTDANHRFTVTENKTLTANFKADTFTVTAQSENPAMGSVSISPEADSEGKYTYGKFVTLDATPAQGYTFDGWYSAGQKVSDQASYIFAVMSNAALTARFKAVAYTISYDLAGGELPQGASNPAGYSVDSEAITLVNPEKTGYTFAGWTGTGLTEATQTVTIPTGSTGNRSYTATWTVNHAHMACGAASCSHSSHTADVAYLPWDGTTPLTIEADKTYAYYLTKAVNVNTPIVVPQGATLYLCINKASLTGKTEADLFTVENGGHLIICSHVSTNLICPVNRALYIKAGGSAELYNGIIWSGAGESMIRNEGTLLMQGTCMYATTANIICIDNRNSAEAEISNLGSYSNPQIGGRTQMDTTGIYNHKGAKCTISNLNMDKHDTAIINEGMFILREGGRKTSIERNKTGIRTTGTLEYANASITNNSVSGVEYLAGTMTIDSNGVYLNIKDNGPETARRNLYMKDGQKVTLGQYYGAARIGVTHEKQNDLISPIDFVQAKTNATIAGEYFASVFTSDLPDYTTRLTTDAKTGQLVLASGKVTVVGGTGSAAGQNSLENVNKGATVSIKADNPANGYVFTGWTSEDGVTFADAAAAETSFVMPGKDVTVKANFAKVDYTITYDLAGGALPQGKSNPAGYSVDTPSFKLEEPEKTGYTFNGWTGSNGDTPQKGIGVAAGSTGNLNFTANYAPVVYSITIDLNGGAMREGETNPATYTIETEAFTLKNPEMEGYAFVGWTGSNGEQAQQNVTIAKGSTGDLSYTANYSLNYYQVSVSCDPAMGTVTGGGEYGHGTQATLSAEPNAGYVFMRWVNDQGETVSEEAVYSFTVYGPCSLTAVFEAQAVDLPKTGDDSNLALWCSLMMMCSACALMLARKRRA